MLVTDIKKIDDKRSCLYLDYEAFGPLYASDIRRLKLTVGSETDAEKMQQFRSEYFFKRAMNKAVFQELLWRPGDNPEFQIE